MEKFESGISKEKQKSIELGVNDVYDKFDKILHDEKLTNDEKKKEIDNLVDKDVASKTYFVDLKDFANDYFDGKYSNQDKTEDDYKKDLENLKSKSIENILNMREDAYATFAQKEERDKCKDNLRSIGVSDDIVDNLSTFQIDEILKNFSSPTINEDFLETLDDLNLPRKDADKIKKQYQYKVEGKISSGLSELDTFLEMIQPGLDLILKTGAKLFYEGIVDNVEKKFLGNEELDVKSDFEIWAENKNGLKKSYDFLHKFGELPPTDTFKYRTNTIKDENHVATYFNQMIIDKINENRINDYNKQLINYQTELANYEQLLDIYNNASDKEKEEKKMTEPEKPSEPKKLEKFNGNVFDETKDISETRFALQDIITDVIRASRDKDENGQPIAKPTDEGKAALNSIMYLTDLFNKKNSPEFNKQFSDLINYYKDGYEEKYTGEFVEEKDFSDYEKKQKEEQKRYQAILGDDGLDFISKQVAQGNSK